MRCLPSPAPWRPRGPAEPAAGTARRARRLRSPTGGASIETPRDERLAVGIGAHIVAAVHAPLDRDKGPDGTAPRSGVSGRGPASPYRYNAFISYSRKADAHVAPPFQTALQRFAKPWYRMRAVRVFRDDTDLRNEPLRPAVKTALEDSEFLILLASPPAARSKWVAEEVEYWRQHKEPGHLMIVLTEGDLPWNEANRDFEWTPSCAVPGTISGEFADEPRWSDIRKPKKERQLSLGNPEFRAAVADVAASLHHVEDKSQIVGEEVRQHRRTVRLAASASVLLAILALLAGLAALYARDQRNEARAERDLAMSRYLASQAVSEVDAELPRALLLSMEALRLEDTTEAHSALLSGLQEAPSQLTAFLHGHRGEVTSLAFSPDGDTLASGSTRGTITFWDVDRRRRVGPPLTGTGAAVTSVTFSPDGTTLASASGETVSLWDVRRRRRLGPPLTGHHADVVTLAFSPDGKTLASGSNDPSILGPLSGRNQSAIIFWDVERRRQLGKPMTAHGGPVLSLAFSPGGSTLASGSSEKTVILWDVERRRPLSAPMTGHSDSVRSIAFSSDGKTVASASGEETILWDVRRHSQLAESLSSEGGPAVDLALSPDGETLASAGWDEHVDLWDVQRRRLDTSLAGHHEFVGGLAFSPDGDTLASGSDDGAIILWDLGRGHRLDTRLTDDAERYEDVTFSPDGRTLASIDEDAVILRDLRRRRPDRRLSIPGGEVHSVTFSADGKTLTAVTDDREGDADAVVRWDLERPHRVGDPLTGFRGEAQSVAVSPDGNTLAIASGVDIKAGRITFWDAQTGQRVGAPLTGHRRVVVSVAFSPDGNTLASGSFDRTVRLWDVRQRSPIGDPLTGHGGLVNDVAFTPDGNTLAAASSAGTVILWDVQRHRQLGGPLTGHRGAVESVAFSPDGDSLATTGADETIRLWDTSLESWRRHACAIANRNLTRLEWDQFIGSSRPYERTCPSLPVGAGVSTVE
jgi:WD40 repeat protein